MTRARDISRLLGRTDNEVDSEGEIIASSGQIVDSAFVLSQAPAPATFQFYTTLDSLPSSPDAGTLAYVEANTRMYLNDGDGWYSVAAVNLSPSLTLSPSGAITLASDGSTSTVTITATDTDDPAAILSYSVESDGNMAATGTTVTQDSSVFTINPITQAAGGVAGNFTLSFKVSDQIDEAVANKSFSISFQSTGTLTRSASSVNEGSSVTFTLPVSGYTNGDTIPYTISGIQSADLSPATLSGNMVVSGSNATKTITTAADVATEGAQTMTFNADNQSVSVTINDTSVAPAVTLTRNPTFYVGSGTRYYTHSSPGLQVDADRTYLSSAPHDKGWVVATVSWYSSTAGTTMNNFRHYGQYNSQWWNIYHTTNTNMNQGTAIAYYPARSIYNGGSTYLRPQIYFSAAVDKLTITAYAVENPAGIASSDFVFQQVTSSNSYVFPYQNNAFDYTMAVAVDSYARASSGNGSAGILRKGNSNIQLASYTAAHLFYSGNAPYGATIHGHYQVGSVSSTNNGFRYFGSQNYNKQLLVCHINK